jgi:hypothetical protein
MKKKTLLVLILGLGIIFGGGWLGFEYYMFKAKNCINFYEWVVKNRCACPEGYIISGGFTGPRCVPHSQKPCRSTNDCPEGEYCISDNKIDWFCTGAIYGCHYWNPENPEGICAD